MTKLIIGVACLGIFACTVANPTNSTAELTIEFTGNGTGSVTVTSRDSEETCSSTCTVVVDAFSDVEVTARAGEGSSFREWSSLCDRSSSCVLSSDQLAETAELVARFTISGELERTVNWPATGVLPYGTAAGSDGSILLVGSHSIDATWAGLPIHDAPNGFVAVVDPTSGETLRLTSYGLESDSDFIREGFVKDAAIYLWGYTDATAQPSIYFSKLNQDTGTAIWQTDFHGMGSQDRLRIDDAAIYDDALWVSGSAAGEVAFGPMETNNGNGAFVAALDLATGEVIKNVTFVKESAELITVGQDLVWIVTSDDEGLNIRAFNSAGEQQRTISLELSLAEFGYFSLSGMQLYGSDFRLFGSYNEPMTLAGFEFAPASEDTDNLFLLSLSSGLVPQEGQTISVQGDLAMGRSTSHSGSLYANGSYYGDVSPNFGGEPLPVLGDHDGFIISYSLQDMSHQWSHMVGSSGEDFAFPAIELDSGNIASLVVTGDYGANALSTIATVEWTP